MSNINRCLPAFPTTEEHGFNNGEPGMTLRDYFAAKAMQEEMRSYLCIPGNVMQDDSVLDAMCKFSYRWADAMLRAREQA